MCSPLDVSHRDVSFDMFERGFSMHGNVLTNVIKHRDIYPCDRISVPPHLPATAQEERTCFGFAMRQLCGAHVRVNLHGLVPCHVCSFVHMFWNGLDLLH